jgi:alanine racemase
LDLTLAQIADATDGDLHTGDPGATIHNVATDSRGTLPKGSIFVALEGEHFDGHDFVAEALAKGAVAALVSRDATDDLQTPTDAHADGAPGVVTVDDTLDALQNLAHVWRERFDIPVVGVTGSNGKTIVKDMLGGIFARETTVHRSPASYNSQVGVPLSLLGLRDEHDMAVIEAGISRPGEMVRLENIIEPTAGLLTNIGLAHAAGLKTLETTAREKLELFRHLDDDQVFVHPAGCEPLEPFELPGRPISFGCTFSTDTSPAVDDADYLTVDVEHHEGGFTFTVAFPDGRRHEFDLHVPGEHNLLNAVASVALARELGASIEAIREGLAAYETSPLRLEMHTTPRGVTLINDAYSSDPVAARAALRTLEQYGVGRRKIAILGDMLDLGRRSEQAHRELGRVAARAGVDQLICYGDLARQIGESAGAHGLDHSSIEYTDDLEHLHRRLDELLEPDDIVLFKASRRLELDRAARRLLESVAPTRLRIDLDAIRTNYHALRRRLGDETGVMAVVKSFGYGNDSTRVSQTLSREGVDALAVAYPDEGIPLRERGLQLPVLVLNVSPGEADKVVKYNLSALVYRRDVLEALDEQANRRDGTVSVHLNVETGMNRVGLPPDRVLEFARRVESLASVELAGVMTHFPAADIPDEDEFTRDQIATFRGVVDELRDADIDPGTLHAANTAAAWRFPESHFDMVRVGLGLYGLAPSPAVGETADGAERALAFTTRIIHVKDVDPGETVGYGRTWEADQPRRIATIAAGYNDGLPRFMSNGGEVLIEGARCPIVGDVCMDVSMVDVTHLDTPEVGDEVVLFGRQGDNHITVDEIADRGDTINYEILCNISPRVRRIFVRGSD